MSERKRSLSAWKVASLAVATTAFVGYGGVHTYGYLSKRIAYNEAVLDDFCGGEDRPECVVAERKWCIPIIDSCLVEVYKNPVMYPPGQTDTDSIEVPHGSIEEISTAIVEQSFHSASE